MGSRKKVIVSFLLSSSIMLFLAACGGGSGVDEPELPANEAPVAVDDVATTVLNSSLLLNVLENDSDVEGDELSLVIVSQPTSGSVVIEGNQFIFTTGSLTGDFEFQYQANDGLTNSNTATVTVTVSPLEITLDGRIYPSVEGAVIVADVFQSDSSSVITVTSDADGLFSINLSIENLEQLSSFVSLSATVEDELLYYKSYVGSLDKLVSLATESNSVSYTQYPQLELTTLNTAISAFIRIRDKDGIISTDVEMEQRLEDVYGYRSIKLAAVLDKLISGDEALSYQFESIQDILVSESTIWEAIIYINNNVEQTFADLFENITQMESPVQFSNERIVAFSSEPNIYSGNANKAFIFDKDESGSVKLFSDFESVGVDYLFQMTSKLKLDQEMQWSVDSLNRLVFETETVDETVYTLADIWVSECQKSTSVYLTVNQVKLIPLFLGDNIDQYLVKLSGNSSAGDDFDTPCEGLITTEWTGYKLINIKTNVEPISESLIARKFAVSIGKHLESVRTSYSASLIDLLDDGSAVIGLDNSVGSWSFDQQGNLEVEFADSSTITYSSIGTKHNKIHYVARKIFADGSNESFSGIFAEQDSNLSDFSLIGRYEVISDYESIDNYIAFAFQENGLGQEQARYSTGWTRRDVQYADLNYFRWNTETTGLEFAATFSAKNEGNWVFSNQSANGCLEGDSTCDDWRIRNVTVLSEDEDYIYMMFNNTGNDGLFGGSNLPWYSGFVWAMKRTDFVLPPVE